MVRHRPKARRDEKIADRHLGAHDVFGKDALLLSDFGKRRDHIEEGHAVGRESVGTMWPGKVRHTAVRNVCCFVVVAAVYPPSSEVNGYLRCRPVEVQDGVAVGVGVALVETACAAD